MDKFNSKNYCFIIPTYNPNKNFEDVIKNGGNAILSYKNHFTGTDRIYEGLINLNNLNYDYILNLQGDEPLLDIDDIKNLNKKAKINFLPLQPGDVPDTYASMDNLEKQFNYRPSTSVIDGVSKFVNWFKDYYQYV